MDALGLGKSGGTDFLGVSYSSVDYVGHTFGPRSWEIQDVLVRLDKDLGELLKHLDEKVGRGKYVVALSADHGVAPIPADIGKTGVDAGILSLPELKERIEKALERFNYPNPAIARVAANDIYFSHGSLREIEAGSCGNARGDGRGADDAWCGSCLPDRGCEDGELQLAGIADGFLVGVFCGKEWRSFCAAEAVLADR